MATPVSSQTIQTAVKDVFPGEPPVYEQPSSRLARRGILFPVPDGLTLEQFTALSEAALSVSDESFYLSNWDRYRDPDVPQDFVVGAFDFDEYVSRYSPDLEHAIVSPHSSWGVLVISDGAAVVAGDDLFMSVLYRDLPGLDDQVVSFARDMRKMNLAKADAAVRSLLEGLFGAARARTFLKVD